MARAPIPTWCFSVVVVQRGHEFLLVHERKHGQGWYLPAGRVEPGESFAEAAVRETLEETGVPVLLDGILRFERSLMAGGGARQRVVFHAIPRDDTPPRTEPNEDTLGAGWFSLDALGSLPLRGEEVRSVIVYVLGGGTVFPLSLLQAEGNPW